MRRIGLLSDTHRATQKTTRFAGFKIKRNWVLAVFLAISAFVPEFFNFKVKMQGRHHGHTSG